MRQLQRSRYQQTRSRRRARSDTALMLPSFEPVADAETSDQLTIALPDERILIAQDLIFNQVQAAKRPREPRASRGSPGPRRRRRSGATFGGWPDRAGPRLRCRSSTRPSWYPAQSWPARSCSPARSCRRLPINGTVPRSPARSSYVEVVIRG